jgi:anti-sigma regulatory factor (Ser/Thr protein kinase)
MPRFVVPTNASLHAAKSLIASAQHAFDDESEDAVLLFHPGWVHVEPIALSMMAAWGTWCRRRGYSLRAENLGKHTAYAARMRLFQQLGIDFDPGVREHEETGRFLALTQVCRQEDLSAVIANISAILHLQDDPESLAAVQYCISELLRNVLEHSSSPDGAFVCAHRFSEKGPHRVTIAVADCGQGVTAHLAKTYPEVADDDVAALGLAMQPGITGAKPGMYGTPENAGAGLFITRCIAKGTGGYFLLSSGRATYRLRRALSSDDMIVLYGDPYDDDRGDRWTFAKPWNGTVAVVEIRTETIRDYDNFFQWIFRQIPSRKSVTRRIRFT